MCDGDGETVAIAQTMLESVLPGAAVRSIATAPVSQDGEDDQRLGSELPLGRRPVLDAINGELWV